MENAKITRTQLFILLLLYEIGTTLVIPLGVEAGREAWLATFLSSFGGVFLFLIYFKLYQYYPNDTFTSYIRKIIGKFAGSILGYLYIIYFSYLSARVLRDFGELLLTFAYPDTPLFVINAVMILAIIYGVRKGIEVIARTGELNIVPLYFLAVMGFILIWLSGNIDLSNLKPYFEHGFSPVIKTIATQTLYVPFGEIIVFTFIFPYLNNKKQARTIGITAILLSGINLSITMAINIATLGLQVVEDSPFPLLATIQEINVANFLERLDVFFLVALFIGAFFKISLYFYVVTVGAADLFKLKSHSIVAFPFGVIVLILSMTIASNFAEHIKEGLNVVPLLFGLPFQIIIPTILLLIAFIKNKRKQRNSQSGNKRIEKTEASETQNLYK